MVTYGKMPVRKILWNLDIKLWRRNKDNNTYDFLFQKVEINVSNHGDTNIFTRERKNSIFAGRDEDMIF